MAFFGKSLVSRKIEIDANAVSSDSPEIKKRLDRIELNYSKLEGILEELETRFVLDDRITSAAPDEDRGSSKLSKRKPK